MPNQSNDDSELDWRSEPGLPVRRIGRSKTSGVILLESKLDEQGREIERISYYDDGKVRKRITYEYDQERQPRLISVFDEHGALVWSQERGKRPKNRVKP